MNESENNLTTRREFLKHTGKLAAASTLAGAVISTGCQTEKSHALFPNVHPGGNNTIRIALVGCGGRGGGAADNALLVKNGPINLVAMADVFKARLNTCYETLKAQHALQFDVPADRKFLGFDAYRHAMDCLRPGDIVILATPPAFRWVHFSYAIQKGLNVFMEKPVTVDGPTTRRMFKLADDAKAKNLKCAVGLMCRHSEARQELFKKIKDGAIGDIITMRAYRMHGAVGHCFAPPKPSGISELLYQVQEFHSFLWASGGLYSDFYIHNIDECCWMKDAWPIKAQALGGRHHRSDAIDQNFDNYSVEYTFADGTKMFLDGRTMNGCHEEFASYAHGSKAAAVISSSAHSPAYCRIFKNQTINQNYRHHGPEVAWAYSKPERNPYQNEWDDFIDAIRNDKPCNEVKCGAEASLVTSMGRMAAHTGQVVTWDDILNSNHEFAPDLDKLTADSPAPLQLAANGKYPVPMPGITTTREY